LKRLGRTALGRATLPPVEIGGYFLSIYRFCDEALPRLWRFG
jgi:hypothetical protein